MLHHWTLDTRRWTLESWENSLMNGSSQEGGVGVVTRDGDPLLSVALSLVSTEAGGFQVGGEALAVDGRLLCLDRGTRTCMA